MVTVQDIREAVRDLGLSGRPICVHASLRSFGWVAGGASTVVEGLLAEGCTVMVPSFSYGFAVPPPLHVHPPLNACDYEPFNQPTPGIGQLYTPECVEIDADYMGAISATIVGSPERVRGNHPLNSFAAIGPLARKLIDCQGPLNIYAPLSALARLDGAVVLMGVGLDKLTLLHLAEQDAGRNMFIRWANGPDGRPRAVTVGGCSNGFVNLDPLLAPLMQERKVGESRWRTFPVADLLEVGTRAIRENPGSTHCGDPQCRPCHDAALGGPILPATITVE